MNAERLREAASLLRERAEAASPGPWDVAHASSGGLLLEASVIQKSDGLMHDRVVGSFKSDPQSLRLANTTYIATMSPPVALALADWLAAEAKRVEEGSMAITFDGSPMFPPNPQALTVANAILGDQP